jgi:acyl-ACP thioesterase
MSDNLIQISKFHVTSAETDMYSRLRLGALVNMLIQAAIISADNLGFGLTSILENKLFWVLRGLTLKIERPVKWYEEVTVETWPKDVNRLLYLRDFQVKQKGELIATATSGWLAVDLESKRPKNVEPSISEPFTRLRGKHAIRELPEKVEEFRDGEIYEVHPRYFDLDLNKHVTSTRYIDWMMDMIPGEYHKVNYPREISINYLRETMPDEILQIRWLHEGKQHLFEGMNHKHSTIAFRGKIIF